MPAKKVTLTQAEVAALKALLKEIKEGGSNISPAAYKVLKG